MSVPARPGRRLLVVVTALLISVLSACGGDDDATTTTTTTTGATTATTSDTTTSDTTTSGTDDDSTTASSTTATTSATTTTTTSSSTSTTASATTATSTTSTTGSSTTAATRTVKVYFSTGDGTDCSEVTDFDRTVDASTGPALAAFEELVGGPTAGEEADGASSFFSSATVDAVRSVTLTGGVLIVDLDDIRADISNAGTSCGSAAFTSGLNATAFQFPTVDRARYLFAGSCDDFGGFIQTDFCEFDRNR